MKLMPQIAALALASSAKAFWILNCGNPVVVDRVDPLATPGQIPGRHVHTVMGGNAFSANLTTYEQTQKSTCTSCSVTKDLSNYWFPQLFFRFDNGSFAAVKNSGGSLIYYLHRHDKKEPEYAKGLQPFPEGFRMIAGEPLARQARNDTDQGKRQTKAVSFACLRGEPTPATPYLPKMRCKNGLRAQIHFPACWNGKDNDSPDHKSHVAYPSGVDNGICPPGFPKRLITLFSEVIYQVDKFDAFWDPNDASKPQPFVFSHGDPTGYGYHGDFQNGWDTAVLKAGIKDCNEGVRSVEQCSAFNGLVQKGDAMKKCVNKPQVDEKVFGVLGSLPGCNPVPEQSKIVHPAIMATCAARSESGQQDITKDTGVLKVSRAARRKVKRSNN